MKPRFVLLTALYLILIAGFCLFRRSEYLNSLEEIQPYAHYYELQLPETSETALNINEASAAKLAALPGISRSVAEKIVKYREQNGNFADISELSEFLPETLLSDISFLLCCPEVAEPSEITEISTETPTEVTKYSEIMTESVIPDTTEETTTEISEPVTETEEEIEEIVFPLELNQASAEELCAVPGIGSVKADAIITYREEHGGFLNCEQLLEVPGIGEAVYNSILPYLYLETEYYPEPEEEPEIIEEFPEPEEIQDLTEPPEETLPEMFYINLNTATREELLRLPHCTEDLADEILILRDRDIHIFYNILEITLAEHVTTALFLEWEKYLTVDDDGSTQIPYIRPGI